ncbi:MAG: HAD family hydrolase [Alphaproteobacteria bacterium]
MSAILVDVDGTLLPGPSSEALFVAHLLRRQHIGPRQMMNAALFVPRWGPQLGRHVLKKNKAYLDGLAVDDVARWAEAFVEDRLAPRLRPALIRRLDEHRAAGQRIVLLTGAPEFIAGPLARRIDADAWRATCCARRNGAFTADPPVFHPFSEDKLRCSLELCTMLGCELDDCTAYGDSVYDLPLLRRVGRPVAVFPDRRLARTARDEGWEIVAA